MRFVTLAALIALAGCASNPSAKLAESAELSDASRDRRIPIALYFPKQKHRCTYEKPCPVAFVSSGYGLLNTDYSFIANALVRSGHLVVAIQHDLPSDPALSRTGDLFASRLPIWRRGAENIRFVRNTLSKTYTGFDWSHLTLLGHSNGGDISALALHESPDLATALVTLDNRRYPLPRDRSISVLSIRGSDFEADAGVLPSDQEKNSDTCITSIAGSRHNDMNDHGPEELKTKMTTLILQFLEQDRCGV